MQESYASIKKEVTNLMKLIGSIMKEHRFIEKRYSLRKKILNSEKIQ